MNTDQVKLYNRLSTKGAQCFDQIIKEKIIPFELLILLLENQNTEKFDSLLRKAIIVLNLPQTQIHEIMDERSEDEDQKIPLQLNLKVKKCLILALLFHGIGAEPADSVAFFVEHVSDDELVHMGAIVYTGTNAIVRTRGLIHDVLYFLPQEFVGQIQNKLIQTVQSVLYEEKMAL